MSILTLHVQRRDYPRWLTDSMARLAGRVGWIVCIDPPPYTNPFPQLFVSAVGGRRRRGGRTRPGRRGCGAYGALRRLDRIYAECFGTPTSRAWRGPTTVAHGFYVRQGPLSCRWAQAAGPCWSVGWPGGTADRAHPVG